MLNKYICALDLGSSKISGAVAEVKRGRVASVFFESTPVKGIKRGIIVDSAEVIGGAGRVLKKLKAKSGINIKSLCVNISGSEIVTRHSRSIIPLTERGNKVITLSDIQKVNEQARILAANLEEEIIHLMPFSYSIDSRSNILNPLGLYSHRLEVDLYLICAKLSCLQGLARVVSQAGYEIKKVFFSGLATSQVVFEQSEMTAGGLNILCDIGRDIAELLIFKDGQLFDIAILPLGGDELTEELSNALRIPPDLAEDTKRSYGAAGDYNQLKEDKEILIKKDNIYKPIKQKLVCEIITAKTKTICENLKEALDKRVDLSQVNNFVVVGRTILLDGFLEMLENTLQAKVKIGRVADKELGLLVNKDNNLSGQKYLTYLTCLGMLAAALKAKQPQALPAHQATTRNPLARAVNRFKEVYEEYF
ncbi:MAG: cell division protein FtsA [Candidatus Omnitrophica bacterium]|nr:cell division protein FtsA [Candidatus Omnitrophota bacterium]